MVGKTFQNPLEIGSIVLSESGDLGSEVYEMTEIDNQLQSSSTTIDVDENSQDIPNKQYITRSCAATSEILTFFDMSQDFEDGLLDNGVIAVKFIVDEESPEIKIDDLNNMIKKFVDKGVVLIFCGENCSIMSIYWKPKEIQHFKSLKQRQMQPMINSDDLYEYVTEFLIKSLKNDELGFINRLSQQAAITEIDINFLVDSRGYNLLLLAAEYGNAEMVKILHNLGMSTNMPRNRIDAQSLALDGKHFDVLLVLAQANLTYPGGLSSTEIKGEFRDFCDDTEELHRLVIANDAVSIQAVLDKHKLSHFYNFKNESALKIAIQNDSIEVYDILLSRKCKFGPHENPGEYLEKLSKESKKFVKLIHYNYSIVLYEKHINVLIENSFICHDETDADKKAEYVQRAYRALDSIPFIRIILMVIAASKKFKIIFDFNNEAVNVLDPTKTAAHQASFSFTGRISIGAKQLLDSATETETLATMAHEFCHFAMSIVYENRAKPYKKTDHKTEDDFEKITQICEDNKNYEGVIKSVFNAYVEHEHHAELIVRVVHLMALYRNEPEKLEKVQTIFSCLFEFYEKKNVPELQKAVKEMEHKEKLEMEKKDKLIVRYKSLIIIISILAAIGIVGAGLIVRFVFFPHIYIFDELEKVDQDKVRNATVTYKDVNVTFADIFADDSEAYGKLYSDHIGYMLNGRTIDLSNSDYHYLDDFVVHDWKNLTGKLKSKVLDSNFNFQNETLRLENLNSINPNIFESLTSNQIIQVLEGETLNVSSMFVNTSMFYIERKFDCVSGCANMNHITFDQTIEIAEDTKMFLLSSAAGTGKTEVFKKFTVEIKKKNPLHWVTYLNLKDFEEFYHKLYDSIDVQEFLRTILNVNLENDFGRTIFEECYKSNRMVLVWDGFDEVSIPNQWLVRKLFKEIRQSTGIIQAISTKPEYGEKLQDLLATPAYSLIDLDENGKEEFLYKFLKSTGISDLEVYGFLSKIGETIEKIKPLVATLQLNLGTPQMLKLVASFSTKIVGISDWSRWGEFNQIYQTINESGNVNTIDVLFKDPDFVQRLVNTLNSINKDGIA